MQAVFAVPLQGASLRALHPFLAHVWSSGGSFPEAALRKLEQSIVAKLTFALTPDQGSAAPAVQLHMPLELEAVMGGPPFSPDVQSKFTFYSQ